jgi:hypothetical protein
MSHFDSEGVRRHIMFRWRVLGAGVAFASSWLLAALVKRSTVEG